MAVPPESLPDFLVRMQNVLKRHQITASLLCHAGHGQLHSSRSSTWTIRPTCSGCGRLAEELYQEVFDAGGTISGEHACGLSRTPFLARQVGPLYEVLREVKQIFDPGNILNPGKIVGDDPELADASPAAGAAPRAAAAAPPPSRAAKRPPRRSCAT